MFLLFNIINPFKKIAKKFYYFMWYWDKRISEYKWFEIETFIDSEHLFQLQLDLRLKGRDHAGPSIEIVFFCLGFSIKIYDQRHWDYEKNNWEIYDWGDDDL
jgi:hypothetical protein